MYKLSYKLSEELFDIISGTTYNEAVLREVKSLDILTEAETLIISAYLSGEASNNTNGYFWFKAQDIVLKLKSMGL